MICDGGGSWPISYYINYGILIYVKGFQFQFPGGLGGWRRE